MCSILQQLCREIILSLVVKFIACVKYGFINGDRLDCEQQLAPKYGVVVNTHITTNKIFEVMLWSFKY